MWEILIGVAAIIALIISFVALVLNTRQILQEAASKRRQEDLRIQLEFITLIDEARAAAHNYMKYTLELHLLVAFDMVSKERALPLVVGLSHSFMRLHDSLWIIPELRDTRETLWNAYLASKFPNLSSGSLEAFDAEALHKIITKVSVSLTKLRGDRDRLRKLCER